MTVAPAKNLGLAGTAKARNANFNAGVSAYYETEFLAPGTWTWPGKVSWVEVFIVGGGGGGGPFSGAAAGGGGGGGRVLTQSVPVSAPVPVTVGAGGAAQTTGGTSYFGPAGPGPVPLIPSTTVAAGGGGYGGSSGSTGGSAPPIGGGSGGGGGNAPNSTGNVAFGGSGCGGSMSPTVNGGAGGGSLLGAMRDSSPGRVIFAGVGHNGFGGGGAGGGGPFSPQVFQGAGDGAGSDGQAVKDNTGGGGAGAYSSPGVGLAGASGYVLVRWYE